MTLPYLTRAEWGANTSLPRLGAIRARSLVTHPVIHHSVIVDSDSTPDLWETDDEIKSKMRQLQVIRPDLGRDVPYHFVGFCMADGRLLICEGRGEDRRGAHAPGHNTSGLGFCFEGDFTTVAFDLMPYLVQVSYFLGWLRDDATMSNLDTVPSPAGNTAWGHREIGATSGATACPGNALWAQIANVLVLGGDVPHPYTDIAGTTFEADIAWLWETGITKDPGPEFEPDATMTRGEAAAFLHRLSTYQDGRDA